MGEENNGLVIEWIKEASKEMRIMRNQNTKDHKEIRDEMVRNREDFVIFKTNINARTVAISTIIAMIVAITTLILNIREINKVADIMPPTEQIDQE